MSNAINSQLVFKHHLAQGQGRSQDFIPGGGGSVGERSEPAVGIARFLYLLELNLH